MNSVSGDFDVAEKWHCNRWANFHKNLLKVAESNTFQRNHSSALENACNWSGFGDFIEASPFTTKEDLAKDRLNNPPYGTNLTFPFSEYKKFNQTSGTLGKPMAWMDTDRDWNWMLDNWNHVLQSANIKAGECCFFAFSFGPFLGFWTAYEASERMGCLCIPGGGQSTEQRLNGIIEHNVDHLFCTPTYALRLTTVAEECGINLSSHNLKSIIVAGETGGSVQSFRDRLRSAWGNDLEIHDHYGMTEVGPVAYETPGSEGGLRIILDSYFPEVIDPYSEETVQNEGQGELVLTTLGRTGCPVFRYRTGDLVKVRRSINETGLPTFDLLGGILGRVDDMIVVRGVNLYPTSVDAVISRFPEITEYQVVFENCESMLEAKVIIESKKDLTHDLEVALQESFSLRIPVERVEAGILPRHEMKAKRWLKL